MILKFIIVTLFTVLNMHSNSSKTADIEVRLQNLNSNKGKILLAIYDQPSAFPDNAEKAVKTYDIDTKDIINSTIILQGLKPGNYAISLMHDSNNNGKMDYNAIGFPKEGYGFSNNPKIKFSAPSFLEASFTHSSPKTVISISLNY